MPAAVSRLMGCVGFLLIALPVILFGCEQRMNDQPKYGALEVAPVLSNKQAAQWPPAGTVSRAEEIEIPTPTLTPIKTTPADIERGGERYEIYCVPCHGVLGKGEGPVVKAGFPQPPSFHNSRLRQAGISHFYEVISQGHGIMYAYADRVARGDRWRIAFYIQALQQSQSIDVREHSEFRQALEIEETSP